ncbi:TIGR03545 family protein [Adhaeretor mobilis]|uniref:TIGR03545 family protein n=1 Tax=Adhaeretor mobilis TaxID=1930276 RepID=A0A517MS50_9BACT|nr:TIGR03545 family protein [Adhaeretor mobilis]QDS97709.1 hypothetical protein HG15A2_09740 [Adhaeretor mobilis]
MKRPKIQRPKIKGLLRWKYVLPRLAIVLVIVLAVRFCLDGALRWAMVAGGESALGAKVEIAELETKLSEGRITLRGIAAVNPGKTFHNLAEAEEANFQIDMTALLHKRVVVTDGTISGLQFDTPRETDGALEIVEVEEEETGPSVLDPLKTAAGEYGAQWADNLSKKLETDLESSLESPRVAKELQERWPAEYETLQQRVKDLQVRGKEIEKSFREVKSNPLRNLDRLQKLEQELQSTEQELKSLTAKIQSLPKQVEDDRKLVDAARKNDEAFVRKMLHLEDLDGDQLSSYLLAEESSGYLSTAVGWVKRARGLMPEKPEVVRSRGVDVLFIDRQRPKWLVQKVNLTGNATLGGQELLMSGMLTNASSHPRLLEQPMQISLAGQGALECDLDVIVDRRGEQAVDTLTFNCPLLAMPSRTLGKPEKLAVSVAGGPAQLHGEVLLTGNNLSGEIWWNQTDVQLGASIGKLKDENLKLALQQSLSKLDTLEANMKLSGTLERPQLKLHSDLGPQLAGSMKAAMSEYLQGRTEEVMAGVREKVDQQLAALTQQREQAQQELLAKLGENQELLTQLASLTGSGTGQRLSIPQLGGLPFGKLKR